MVVNKSKGEHGPHYYVVVYDAEVRRGTKVLKILRRYLHWIQNSVFEGELTLAQYERLKRDLLTVIDTDYDNIVIYRFPQSYLRRENIGQAKGSTDTIL